MRVAVIPARGGSKRIPRKNLRTFAGKPMIAYSIECAQRAEVFDRIVVSTDDAEITAVARDHGAEVPFVRPAALADDYTGTVAVVGHAIEWLRSASAEPTAVCCLYPTAPFMTPGDVREGLRVLESGSWDYVFSATTFPAPVFRGFVIGDQGGLSMLYPDRFSTRSQDLPEVFHDAAQFYWGRPRAWLENPRVFGAASTIVRIPRARVQDIDTEEDWSAAEAIAARNRN